MNRSSAIWTLLFIFGGAGLIYRSTMSEMGKVYVRAVEVRAPVKEASPNEAAAPGPAGAEATTPENKVLWTKYQEVPPKERNEPGVVLSIPRTVGIWIAALGTLAIFSFLVGDNPLYRFAESVFVGASAAYAMVVGFWSAIVQNLLAKLFPDEIRQSLMPGLSADTERQWIYIVPLILGIMMLWRMMPVASWISRWPLAFFIGATAGVRMMGHFGPDFVTQIQSTILPLAVYDADGSFVWQTSLKHTTIVIGVLACLTYFFFSIEHKGVVGRISRLGVWFLMVTFGAGFGYTVMGRIALLSARLEFLFNDWLWLIDPTANRVGM